jgi:hypothetical protein
MYRKRKKPPERLTPGGTLPQFGAAARDGCEILVGPQRVNAWSTRPFVRSNHPFGRRKPRVYTLSNRRMFSMTIAAWSAKVSSNSTCRLINRRASMPAPIRGSPISGRMGPLPDFAWNPVSVSAA